MSKKRIPSDVDRDRLEVYKLVFLFIKYQNLIFYFSVICLIMNFIRYSKWNDLIFIVYLNGVVLIWKNALNFFETFFLFYILDCLSRECFLLYCRCLRVCVCVYHFVSHSILFYVCIRIKLSSATIKKQCSISHSYTLNFLFFVFFSCSVHVCCVRLKKEEKWISLMPYGQREKDNSIIHLGHHLLVLFFWVFFRFLVFFCLFCCCCCFFAER